MLLVYCLGNFPPQTILLYCAAGVPEGFLHLLNSVVSHVHRHVATAASKGGENEMVRKDKEPIPAGFMLIFRAWYTDKDGNRVYAKDNGRRGWPLLVPRKRR